MFTVSRGSCVMELHPNVPTYFGELCELVSSNAPDKSHRRTADRSIDSRYWLELYRWIEFEEAFDTTVEEFSPPRAPNFRFDHIIQLRSRIQNRKLSARFESGFTL